MIINELETIVICSNSEGNIFVYSIDLKDKFEWSYLASIDEGQGEIISMALNETLDIFITCSINGYFMMYTLPDCKLFNSFIIEKSNNKKLYADIIIISESPLPCFVLYSKQDKTLYSYSINGTLLHSNLLGFEMGENEIKKFTDISFNNYLFIYNKNGHSIDILEIYGLKQYISIPLYDKEFIDFTFDNNYDSIFILVREKKNENDNKKNDIKGTLKILII